MTVLCRKPILAAAVAGIMGLVAVPAWAVHDLGAVEMDGDIIENGGNGTDWDEIAAGGALTDVDAGCTFITSTPLLADPAPQTIFHTGGSKDTNDIPKWKWKNGAVPDKNDMTHGIAVAFLCDTGGADDELIVYMAGLRFSNDGDSNIGAWFTAADIGPIGTSNGTFGGQHSDLDLFVTAGFTQGGTVVNIGVYGWNEATGSLSTIIDPASNQANCNVLAGGDTECATANDSDTPIAVPVAWGYTPKSGAANTAPRNSFFELGINTTAVVGDACFTSFLLETRSSTSPTAQLKDFIFGDFDVCGIRVTLLCQLDGDGFNDDFTGFEYLLSGEVFSAFGPIPSADIYIDVNRDTSLNGGLSNTSDDVLLDTVVNIPVAGVTWADDDPPWESNLNPDTLEVYAVATLFGNEVISDLDDAGAVDLCPAAAATTALTITKTCIASLFDNGSEIAIEVRATGTVTNTGTVPLDNVTVTDTDVAGSVNLGTIAALASKDYFIGYVPSEVNSVDPDVAVFQDTAHAEGTFTLQSITVGTNPNATATCELCIGTSGRTLGGIACSGTWPPSP